MSATTQLKASTEPLNKGFLQVVERFTNEGWKLVHNTQTELVFVNPVNLYDEFKMRALENKLEVVIPMPNSPVAYSTKFNNYFEASEYILSRFEDFLAAISTKESVAEETEQIEEE